jgi:hypothetical protein
LVIDQYKNYSMCKAFIKNIDITPNTVYGENHICISNIS